MHTVLINSMHTSGRPINLSMSISFWGLVANSLQMEEFSQTGTQTIRGLVWEQRRCSTIAWVGSWLGWNPIVGLGSRTGGAVQPLWAPCSRTGLHLRQTGEELSAGSLEDKWGVGDEGRDGLESRGKPTVAENLPVLPSIGGRTTREREGRNLDQV